MIYNDFSSLVGNTPLLEASKLCKKEGIDFQERRTIFWDRWEKEADEIMKINNIKLPFFYNTDTGQVLVGNSLTPLDTIENWIKKETINE